MADGDGRAVLTLAEEVWRATRPGKRLDARRLVSRGCSTPLTDVRSGSNSTLPGNARSGTKCWLSRSRVPALSRDSWHGQRIGDALAVEIDERVMHGLVERGDVREGPVGE